MPTASQPADPLTGTPHKLLHPWMYAAEFLGTALLVFGGLSVVIAFNGTGSPLADAISNDGLRRACTGFLFGSIGAAIAYSPIGKISGAHINPAMTFAFYVHRKIVWRDAAGYVIAQILGAVAGAAILPLWGMAGRSISFGATVPMAGLSPLLAVLGEAVCTALLVGLVFFMASKKATQAFTPLINPPLFALLVWLEAPLTGTSANPARSVGPALIANVHSGLWIYFAGPLLGAAAVALAFGLGPLRAHRPAEARVAHFRFPHLTLSRHAGSPAAEALKP